MAVTKKPAAKKPAAKPAAKKAAPAKKTAAKPAAKKTTAKSTAKPVAKKVAAKPVVKKTAPAKTSATELSVTGNKKIGTLQKEFNKKFPYLRLKICYSYARQAVAKGETISGIDPDKTLASVRRADSGGDISISGNKKIKSLEKEFDTVFGLYAQVCYTSKEGKEVAIIPAALTTRKLLLRLMQSARRTVARKEFGNNQY